MICEGTENGFERGYCVVYLRRYFVRMMRCVYGLDGILDLRPCRLSSFLYLGRLGMLLT